MEKLSEHKSTGKLKRPIHEKEGWIVLTFFRQPAYADLGLILIGATPPSKKISPRAITCRQIEKQTAKRSVAMARQNS